MISLSNHPSYVLWTRDSSSLCVLSHRSFSWGHTYRHSVCLQVLHHIPAVIVGVLLVRACVLGWCTTSRLSWLGHPSWCHSMTLSHYAGSALLLGWGGKWATIARMMWRAGGNCGFGPRSALELFLWDRNWIGHVLWGWVSMSSLVVCNRVSRSPDSRVRRPEWSELGLLVQPSRVGCDRLLMPSWVWRCKPATYSM
jgi:hypothetical protein